MAYNFVIQSEMKTPIFKFLFAILIPLLLVRATNGISDIRSLQQEKKIIDSLRTIKNEAFKRGEILKYRMHYGFINAGEIIMQVLDENKKIGERNTLHVVGLGYTNSSFDWFFKVRDKYESYLDEEAIIPWLFIRRVNEGGYKINQNQIYNHYKNTVDSDGKSFDTPDNVQDMISAFYYARTIDFSTAKEGDVFEFPCFVDNEVWPLKIKYMGKETIKSDIGKIRCIKFRPIIQKGRVFKKEEDMNAWISDDKNRIPVRAEAKIAVGSVKMDITEYSGLANPLALEKKK
ncbi:MAG: DUF3108 domain-containing protein [Bacteroidota bacterium]